MNSLAAQIRDLFQSMTAGARITAGLLLLVAVVSIAYLFQTSASGPDAFLFGGERFSQSELTDMEAAMSQAGLTGWKIESNRISVPRALQQDCIAAIASAGALPDNFANFMDDAISKASPMESRQQWELRTKTARENQLSLIVSKMDWVESGHVMVDIQERRGFNRSNQASASVFITPRAGEVLDQARARNIRQLVAGPFASMMAEDVKITSSTGEVGGDGEPWFDDAYLQARSELQKAYKRDIVTLLSYIPGVRVEVSANLDNLAKKSLTESSPSEAQPLRSMDEEETEKTSVNDGGGQPGLAAQGPNRRGLDEGLARTNSSEIVRRSTNEENAVGFSTSEEEYMGFKPKELYASIAIPREYVLGIWQQENPGSNVADLTGPQRQNMESEVKSDVERLVQNILPRLSLGEDEYRQVEVIFIDSLKQAPLAEPTFSDTAKVWTAQYWGALSMIGLALVSLLLLRSAIKPAPAPSGQSAALQLDMPSDARAAEEDDEEAESARPRLRIKKSQSLKEDLSEMVREDPDAAANILRAWINNAA